MPKKENLSNKLAKKQEYDQFSIDRAIYNLVNVTEGKTAGLPNKRRNDLLKSQKDQIIEAMSSIGSFLGVSIKKMPEFNFQQNVMESVEKIATHMGLASRTVSLDKHWWKTNRGPLLVITNDNVPLVAFPRFFGGYRFSRKVSYSDISGLVLSFYRVLDEDALRFRDLFRVLFSSENLKDVLFILIIGIVSSTLVLAIPLLTGMLVSRAIPESDLGLLLSIGLGMLFVDLGTANFDFFHSIVFSRINSRFDFSVPAALFERIVRLPAIFFRKYSSGDLSDRIFGVTDIISTSTNITLDAIISFFFSFFYLFLIVYFSPLIGSVALGGVIILIAVILIGHIVIYQYIKEAAEENGKILGIVVQLLRGIEKLRISHAEKRAFLKWSERFSWMRRREFMADSIENALEVFSETGVLLIEAMIIFIFAGFAFDNSENRLNVADFIIISSAFGSFTSSMMTALSSVGSLLESVPLLKRIQPILKTETEKTEGLASTEITGNIEINQVTFRYEGSTIPAISDFSLKIKPGEFVAVIGPSGSGKSTLVKLLLGFLIPNTGTLFYDDCDLHSLNLRSVRKQIGTVLQNGELIHGTILQNIIGVSNRTINEAWEAARLVAVADEIGKMPMKMHTLISEGAKTISGGQKQRILLAKALINKPKILILDEATSALDNRTQLKVQKNLESLTITRIVIAHRLSTILNADRVVTLQNGKINHIGTQTDIMKKDNFFRQSSSRQII
jgi:NHLM bacteriocin system ABC transporter ATP-binding protein